MSGRREITLILPGLLGPVRGVPADRVDLPVDLPALTTMLSRAVRHRFPAVQPERALAGLFGLHTDLPAADLGYRADTGGTPAGAVLRADPVHLQAGMTALTLLDDAYLAVTADEAASLVDSVNGSLAGESLWLEAPLPSRWYLHLPSALEVRTVPLTEALGESPAAFLPAGPDGGRLRGLLTEIQMLFAEHPVNRRRTEQGRLPVNGVWLWGEGKPATTRRPGCTAVYADHGLAVALACWAGIPRGSLPAGAEPLLESDAPAERLVYLDDALRPARLGELESWLETAERLEALWFAPLLRALRDRRLDAVTLMPLTGTAFRVTRGALARFWRPRRAFGRLLVREP